MDSLLASRHLLISCGPFIQDAEESGLPDGEDNNLQEHNEPSTQDAKDSAGTEQDTESRVYLDLVPVRSFLHTSCGTKTPPTKENSRYSPVPVEDQRDSSCQVKEVRNRDNTIIFNISEHIEHCTEIIFLLCIWLWLHALSAGFRSVPLTPLSLNQHLC